MFYDCAARPLVPDETAGLVYPKQCHGATVFVSLIESALWIGLPILFAVIFGLAVIVNRRIKRDDGWILPVDSDDPPVEVMS